MKKNEFWFLINFRSVVVNAVLLVLDLLFDLDFVSKQVLKLILMFAWNLIFEKYLVLIHIKYKKFFIKIILIL